MSKKPSQKREPTPDNPEQHKRFLESAKEAEASQDPKTLSRALKKIAPLLPKDVRSGGA